MPVSRRTFPGTSKRCTVPACGCQPLAGSSAYSRASIEYPRDGGGSGVEPAAVGDVQLQLDEVQPGGRLGDRMLDLQPGVHLEEEEVAASRRP